MDIDSRVERQSDALTAYHVRVASYCTIVFSPLVSVKTGRAVVVTLRLRHVFVDNAAPVKTESLKLHRGEHIQC